MVYLKHDIYIVEIHHSGRRPLNYSLSHIVEQMKGFSTHGSFCGMTSTMKSRVDDLDQNTTMPTSIKTNEVTMTFDQQAVSRIEQELSQLGQICMASAQDKAQVRP